MVTRAYTKCFGVWIVVALMGVAAGRYIDQQYLPLKSTEPDDLELLTRLYTDLLLSEYNRVTTTNQRLYVVSREPSIFCEESKPSTCVIAVEVEPSSCMRLEPWSDACQTFLGRGTDAKTCVGSVDLLAADVIKQLTCRNGFDRNQVSDERSFKRLLSSLSDDSSQIFPKPKSKILKKQWGDTGGNIYPMK